MSVTVPYTARGRIGRRSTGRLITGKIVYMNRISGVKYHPRTVSAFLTTHVVCNPNGTIGTKNMTASNLRVARGTVRVS